MPINKVGFSAGSEDLADIYISTTDVIEKTEDGDIFEAVLSQEGIDAVFSKTLWAWGQGESGRLGLGGTANQSSPVQVGALTDWKDVKAGGFHSLGVKTSGSLWAWGNGSNGRLGLGGTANQVSPVRVGTLSNWRSVSPSINSSNAVKTDGTMWSWGTGTLGQLGLGNLTNRTSPVRIGTASNWKTSSSGGNFTVAPVLEHGAVPARLHRGGLASPTALAIGGGFVGHRRGDARLVRPARHDTCGGTFVEGDATAGAGRANGARVDHLRGGHVAVTGT